MITFNLQKCSKKKIISEKNKNTKKIQILPEKIKNRKKTVHYYFMPKMIKRHTSHTANYMDMIPFINLNYTWKVSSDGLVTIDMPHTGFYHHIAQKYFHRPKKSCISLDRYGSTLWTHIDGDNTVFNLVSIMEEQFPEEAPDMLKRVIAFLKTLERVRFIYF